MPHEGKILKGFIYDHGFNEQEEEHLQYLIDFLESLPMGASLLDIKVCINPSLIL